jgi:hypothetical protein
MTSTFSHENIADRLRDPRDPRCYLPLYGPGLEACKDARLVLWSKRGAEKIVFASRDPEAIAAKALAWSHEQRDAYLHTCLHRLRDGEGVGYRGSTQSAAVAIGLFEDIDARGPGRKKPPDQLCPTVADAIWVAQQFDVLYKPLRVTLLVNSGHGCYPVLVFKEPLLLDTPEARDLLESLSRRFHQALYNIAAARGWPSAAELCGTAKVLRIVATTNWKDPAAPVPVELVCFDEDVR